MPDVIGLNMEIFYSDTVLGASLVLTADDSQHCVRVLRHREGDAINVVDGKGKLYVCRITNDNPKMVQADILSVEDSWHSHPYRLTMAVCPTKNNDRYEWFIEKATEVGVDSICPVIGDRSERRVYKTDRARKIVLSAAKQSLKALFPLVEEPVSVREFIASHNDGARYIACCFEDEAHPRISLAEALGKTRPDNVTILIGPEGDFSPEELTAALDAGYVPVHLGQSRLRTETAAVVAAVQVYSTTI